MSERAFTIFSKSLFVLLLNTLNGNGNYNASEYLIQMASVTLLQSWPRTLYFMHAICSMLSRVLLSLFLISKASILLKRNVNVFVCQSC